MTSSTYPSYPRQTENPTARSRPGRHWAVLALVLVLAAALAAALAAGPASADEPRRLDAREHASEVPALVRMLGDRERVRLGLGRTDPGSEATQALGEAGDLAVGALTGALESRSAEVRRDAAHALGITLSPRAFGALAGALDDPAWPVRERAAWGLGITQRPEAREPLTGALSDDRAEVRAVAARGLGLHPLGGENAVICL